MSRIKSLLRNGFCHIDSFVSKVWPRAFVYEEVEGSCRIEVKREETASRRRGFGVLSYVLSIHSTGGSRVGE